MGLIAEPTLGVRIGMDCMNLAAVISEYMQVPVTLKYIVIALRLLREAY